MPRPQLARHPHRRRHVDAAGAAEEQALLVQQAIDHGNGFRILHMHGRIDGRVT